MSDSPSGVEPAMLPVSDTGEAAIGNLKSGMGTELFLNFLDEPMEGVLGAVEEADTRPPAERLVGGYE